ncbi:hypothetical protein J2W88_001653 [Acidovorax delafieldii]|uniref:Uncharacterized protein n=1 Tax=Acidovorax delafieldii TaxID=47920 RepID=A0AAJ2BSF8_ACIDE|nr:hypothetical protein [Acidovorax delafieldii]MDR6836674.1 hypothetical protein [Acidovorax delafieldii]MDR7366165.1 hypothetical protein [Acidovorax delafieldii]
MRVPFFRVAERKEPKKGRPHCLRPLRFATGQPAVLGFGGVSLEHAPFHFAQTIASPDPPNPALLGASRGARGTKYPHGPLLRSAQLAQRMALAPARRGRAQQWPEWMLAVRLSHPCWLRLQRGGCGVSVGVEAPMLRALTRRGCPSGARSAKRVPRRTPQPPRRRFAPSLREGVADWGSPFFWVLFFGEAKKSTSPAGATPGLRPQPRHAVQSAHKNQNYKINSNHRISH